MDEEEALLVMQGYRARADDLKEILSRFIPPVVNVHIPRGKKKLKPTDLFQRPKKQDEKEKDPDELKRDRREAMAGLKKDGPPITPRKHRTDRG
jgi:hypothetical protein